MVRAEFPLLNRQTLLQQISLPIGIAKNAIRDTEICQGDRDFVVINAELPLFYRQALLQQISLPGGVTSLLYALPRFNKVVATFR